MDVKRLSAYLPMDRRHALARGHSLPDRAEGAALFADVVGFTQLAHKLVAALGPGRGAEELIRSLNAVYDALIAHVHHYGGSLVGFGGHGSVCWFDRDTGSRATACGLALRQALLPFASVPAPGGDQVAFSLKSAIAVGPVRRLVVGDPQVQRLDLLAGATLERLAQVEQGAAQGEIVVRPEVAQRLGERLIVAGWRAGFGIVAGLAMAIGDDPAAGAAPQEPIHLAQAAHNVHIEAASYRRRGCVLWHRRDSDAARKQLERAIERAQCPGLSRASPAYPTPDP